MKSIRQGALMSIGALVAVLALLGFGASTYSAAAAPRSVPVVPGVVSQPGQWLLGVASDPSNRAAERPHAGLSAAFSVPSLINVPTTIPDEPEAAAHEPAGSSEGPLPAEPLQQHQRTDNPPYQAEAGSQAQPMTPLVTLDIPRRIVPQTATAVTAEAPPDPSELMVLPAIAYKEVLSTNVAPPEAVEEQLSEPDPEPVHVEPLIGTANRIEVPSIQIDMPVRSGSYDDATHTWEVDDSSAFHADITVPVNDTNGTALIYGHAKWGIFGNLPDVREGAEAIVHTDEGLQFVYVFESVTQVDPSDVSMLTAEGAPQLVLQTCSGFFDQHRTLATFRLKEVRT